MPTRQPAVISLLIDRIDSLETSLTKRIDVSDEQIGRRIDDLTTRVGAQNGRIGKCEERISAEDSDIKVLIARQRVNKRQWAMVSGASAAGGAILLAAARVILNHIHPGILP